MDAFWQISLSIAIFSLVYTIYKLYKSYMKESNAHNESQKMAKLSMIFGISGIIFIFLGSAIGIILGIISMRGKKYKALSKIGIALSILTLLPWLLVLTLGE